MKNTFQNTSSPLALTSLTNCGAGFVVAQREWFVKNSGVSVLSNDLVTVPARVLCPVARHVPNTSL